MSIRSALLDPLRVEPPRSPETLAFAILALRGSQLHSTKLLSLQLSNGAWPGAPGGPPNCFHTALAVLALGARAERGLQWLLDTEPIESHWFYKWRFRLFDRQVRFDPTKTGWPWVEGTVSWVAPTAMSILAVHSWRRDHPRLNSAAAMLVDRACPAGGWNAGNSVVFGVHLDPHPDFTAMALLALAVTPGVASAALLDRSLDYLATQRHSSDSAYSLAWATLALAAHQDRRASAVRERLAASLTINASRPLPHTAAIGALALEEPIFRFQELNP